jgi:hypothetical protein
MTHELSTKAVADSKQTTQLTMWIAFLVLLCGMIALADYNLSHYPAMWSAITASPA